MNALQAMIYGVVQGLTAFVPVSSDAHVEITSVLLTGHDPGAPFTAVIQWGTWVACVIYFRKDIGRLAAALFAGIWERRPFATHDAKLAWMLLIGTVPIGVLGLLFQHHVKTVFRGLYVVAAAAIVFALLMALAEWFHVRQVKARKKQKDLEDLGWFETLLVGFAQCFALIPGASRSGTTITAGIFAGMTRDAAARFSFLLSLPSVFAAGLYELYKEKDDLLRSQQDVLNLVIATVVAAIVGYASIALLIRFLKTHSTWVFIGYRLLLGAILLVVVGMNLLPNQPPPAESPVPTKADKAESLGALPETPSKKFAFFARTFPSDRRLYHTSAETVSPPSVFVKWPVTNDESKGILK